MINILIASISGIVTFSLKGKPRGERSTDTSDKTKKRKHTIRGAKAVYRMIIEDGKSGFSVKLGGNRSVKGNFYSIEKAGSFWSDTGDLAKAKYLVFSKEYERLSKFVAPKEYGHSCRCVEN